MLETVQTEARFESNVNDYHKTARHTHEPSAPILQSGRRETLHNFGWKGPSH